MDDNYSHDDTQLDGNADQVSVIRMLDRQHDFSIRERRVALVGFDCEQLCESLEQCDAVIVELEDPSVELLVVDSTRMQVANLAEVMNESVLERVETGDLQIVSRRRLLEHFEREPAHVHRLYTRKMLAELLSVQEGTIRSWQRRGLIQPVSRVNKLDYFDFQEVATAKQLQTLTELGLKPAAIEKNLRKLSTWMPGIERPLGQLSVMVEGNQILLRQAEGLVEAGGQRRLDFTHADPNSSEHQHPDVLPFASSFAVTDDPRTPAQFVALAEEQEELGALHDAIETYRSAQLAFGPMAETCLRLGDLLFRQGDLPAARERYFMAIELDEQLVEARAALGCVLIELGDMENAISAFQGALIHHQDYADVHFQLARALQSAGDSVTALSHWERFLTLSPDGPWADEARSQIVFLRATD